MQNEDGLTPRTDQDGPALDISLDGLTIGTAEYDEGPTGCTVLRFDRPVACEVDVRGGSPGLYGGLSIADAIFFAGGSLYGLETASGIAAEIMARRQTGKWGQVAAVSGAIIYDYGARDTICHPDKVLGRAAFRNAQSGRFLLGQRGAGRSATVGKIIGSTRFLPEPGGQGAAIHAEPGLTVAAFTVVNSVGAVLDRDGSVLRGFRHAQTGDRTPYRQILRDHPEEGAGTAPTGGGNTTVSAIVVDQELTAYELRQVARQVHSAMAGVIQPFHTINDGDILFALSTGRAPRSTAAMAIGEIASDLMATAVRRAVDPKGDIS